MITIITVAFVVVVVVANNSIAVIFAVMKHCKSFVYA